MKWLHNKAIPLYFAMALIGFTSITTQVLFLRELIAIFYGNELIYGLILALWLLSYSIGSGLLGRFADRLPACRQAWQNRKNVFVLTQTLILVLLPIMIFMTRIAKNLLGIPLGTLLNLPTTILITFSALFPLTLILGFQFALGSKILAEEFEGNAREIGSAYMLEAMGAVIGGLLLSFILLSFLNPFQIIALLSILLACSGLLLLRNYKVIIMPILAAALLVASPYLDQISNKLSWKNYHLIKSIDSPYGKLAVIKDTGEYAFFMDGNLLFSTADKPGAEELIHLSFLPDKSPKNILLIGGGFGGALNEILKYPIEKVDYVELDPKVIQLANELIPRKFPPQAQIHAADSIRFLSQTEEKYDLILINLPDPNSALINRFYTREFYTKCRKKLNPNGILIFKLSTSTAYMGTEMRALNASILKTASVVFKEVSLIPGSFNYFFASDHKLNLNRNFLLEKWKERKIKTEFFNAPALSYELSPERIEYVREAIRFNEKTRINTDLQPISYYHTLLLWTSYFDSPLKTFFINLMQIKIEYIFAILLFLLIAIKLFSKRYKAILFPCVVAFLGFAGMTTQMIIILTFQARFGYVYQMIGLLTAAFMAGLALGSFVINRNYERIRFPAKTMLFIFSLFIIYGLFLIFGAIHAPFPISFFPVSSLIIGSFVGAIFPLAVKLQQTFQKEIGGLAGVLYGADLLGSSLAAIAASIFLIPIYGTIWTGLIAGLCVLCALGSLW